MSTKNWTDSSRTKEQKVVEMDKDSQIHLRVSSSLKEDFETECKLNEETPSEVLREFMREYATNGDVEYYRSKLEAVQAKKQFHLEQASEQEETEERLRQQLESAREQEMTAEELRRQIIEDLQDGTVQRVFEGHAEIERLADLEGKSQRAVLEEIKEETDLQGHRFEPLQEGVST